MEQVVLCAVCLMLVAMARVACCKATVCLFKKEPSASLAFPMWEAPVFITQFMGVTESLMALAGNECWDVKIVSIMLLIAGPGAFIAYAAVKIYRYVNKDGSLEYEGTEKPSWESCKQSLAGAKWYGKIFVLNEFVADCRSRGSWGDDNLHERHWMFMVGDLTKPGVFYCVWLLLRKILVIFVMEHLDGSVNAATACALQFIDTALLLILMPFNDWQTMGAEGLAAVCSLLAYFSLSLPVFGWVIPVLDFSDDVKLLIASMGSLLAGASSFTTSIAKLLSGAILCYSTLQNATVFEVVAGSGAGGLVAGFMVDETLEQVRAKAVERSKNTAESSYQKDRNMQSGRDFSAESACGSKSHSQKDGTVRLGREFASADRPASEEKAPEASIFEQSLFVSEAQAATSAELTQTKPIVNHPTPEAYIIPNPSIHCPRPPRRSPPPRAPRRTSGLGGVATTDQKAESSHPASGEVALHLSHLFTVPLMSTLDVTSKNHNDDALREASPARAASSSELQRGGNSAGDHVYTCRYLILQSCLVVKLT